MSQNSKFSTRVIVTIAVTIMNIAAVLVGIVFYFFGLLILVVAVINLCGSYPYAITMLGLMFIGIMVFCLGRFMVKEGVLFIKEDVRFHKVARQFYDENNT